ncbi:MAG TPA: helix-turn-helix domain-containing protein [Streptosporangiaceae bacterium]|nr:helix-turn-helix domain-containing protein [Streptosporangiaceae bacterium]
MAYSTVPRARSNGNGHGTARGPAPGAAGAPGAWPKIPSKVADQLRPVLPMLVEEMVAEIHATVAEYARPGDDSYEHAVRRGAEEAAGQFVNRIADPGTSWDQAAAVFRRLGEGEASEGRSLEALQSALRAGARVALRWLTRASQWMEAPLETLGLLAEALFVFLDEIAALSAEGYAQAQAQVAGELQRRRRRLLSLVLAEPPAAMEAIGELARLAQWRLPRLVSVVVLAGRHSAGGSVPALPAEVLQDLDRAPPVLLAPDPYGPGRRGMLDRGLRGFQGAVGPPVALRDAGKSMRWAREALTLAEQGAFGDYSIIHCDDHLTDMVLRRGGDLLDRLEARRLAPLRQMAPGRQDMLAETLLAWLETGKSSSVASRLFIHPQTARYRLHKLQDLFGEQLENPEARFELALVLRARHGSPQQRRGCEPDGG